MCDELIGPATLHRPPYQPVRNEPFVLLFDDDEGQIEGPIVIEVAGGTLSVAVHTPEAPTETAPPMVAEALVEAALPTEAEPAAEADPAATAEVAPAFAHFEKALATALMAQGASRAAALVPHLLRLESLPADGLSKDVLLTLQSRGYLDGNARYSQKFRALWGAWSAVLLGSSQDFAACGTTTLDRFGADLLAALLAVPATRADELRRELRKAGIAAFGVLEAA